MAPPYEFSYLDSTGKRRWEVVHGNLAEAETRKAEMMLRRRRGEQIRHCRLTFAQYAEEWLPRQTVKPRTLEIYSWALNRHLLPYFGRRRLDQISVDDLTGFVAAMAHKELKSSTITTALRPLSKMLAQAARNGEIPVNPFTQLVRGERPRDDDRRPKRILNLAEMRAILAAAADPQHRCLLELLMMSGLRIGEALGLTVGDLNATDAIVRVDFQLSRDGTRTAPKSARSRRVVAVPALLVKQLLELAAERGKLFDPQALVFASRNGSGLERKVCREALKRAAKTANLAAPHPSLHDLRHSHTSMLIALGCSISEVQHRLGHSSPTTTLAVYTHLWDYASAQKSTIGDQLGALFAPNGETPDSGSSPPTGLRAIGD